MHKSVFCNKCNTFVDYSVQYEDVIQNVKDDTFTLNLGVPYCLPGHHEVYVEEIDLKNQQMVFNAYREKHHLVSINEIISIRKTIGLSQRDFSRLLGLGEISITRYELGSLPSLSISTLILSSRNIENLKEMYEKNKKMMSDNGIKKIEIYLSKQANLIFSGNIPFNVSKLYELTYLITLEAFRQNDIMFPTKMNRLIFYVDFIGYKLFNKSVTGSTYYRTPYGPALMSSDFHYDMNNLIIMKSDYERRWMLPKDKKCELSKLNTEEKKLTLSIYSFFAKLSTKNLFEYSDKELTLIGTELGKPISYEYAEKLELIM